jgi:hypothetical protein
VARLKHKYRVGDYGEHRALVRCGKGTTDVLIGKDDLSEWDDEELRRGRKRDKNGGWQGRDPVIVPKAVHDELVKRTLSKANKLLTENLEAAVELLTDIMRDPDVDPKDRIKAIDMVMNRAMGREPQRLEIDPGDKPWQLALAHSIVSMPAELIDPNIHDRDEDNDDDDKP